jgi:hypothetical protein
VPASYHNFEQQGQTELIFYNYFNGIVKNNFRKKIEKNTKTTFFIKNKIKTVN